MTTKLIEKQEYPIKRSVLVKAFFFDCGHPLHRHESKQAALNCIKRAPHRKPQPLLLKSWEYPVSEKEALP